MAEPRSEIKRLIEAIAKASPGMEDAVRAALLSIAQTAQGEQRIREIADQKGIVAYPQMGPPGFGTPQVGRTGVLGTPSGALSQLIGTERVAPLPKIAPTGEVTQPTAKPKEVGATPTRADVLQLIRQGKLDEAEWLLLTIGVYDEETNPEGMNETEYSTLDLAIERARKRTTTTTGAAGYTTPQWKTGEYELAQEQLKFQREQERNTILDRLQRVQSEIAQMQLAAAQNAVPPGLNYVPGTEPGGFLGANPYHRGGQVPLVSTPFTPPPMPTLQQLGGY